MTNIRQRMKVPTDGNVIVPVGASEAGTEVEVVVTTFSPIRTAANESHSTLSREQWIEKFLNLEGSITDPSFRRPDQLPLDSIPSLD